MFLDLNVGCFDFGEPYTQSPKRPPRPAGVIYNYPLSYSPVSSSCFRAAPQLVSKGAQLPRCSEGTKLVSTAIGTPHRRG